MAELRIENYEGLVAYRDYLKTYFETAQLGLDHLRASAANLSEVASGSRFDEIMSNLTAEMPNMVAFIEFGTQDLLPYINRTIAGVERLLERH